MNDSYYLYSKTTKAEANIAWLSSTRETIENECIAFEMYLYAEGRVLFHYIVKVILEL